MSDNVKVKLSKEFLARIAVATQRNGSPPDIEPINSDFDRNSPLAPEAVATYTYLYAKPNSADDE